MRSIAIIPARYASTRFPAKPLVKLGDKFIIQHVYERVTECVEMTYVATDDERIFNAVKSFGGNVVMTSSEHRCGTDRCCEALAKIGYEADIVINIQGDEPFVQREHIELLKSGFESEDTDIVTLAVPFSIEGGLEALENPNSPKVVIDESSHALYFSRSVIPYIRGVERGEWLNHHTFYKHIGIYAFRPEVLKQITKLLQSPLEKAESLEQLRWLENGYKIGVGISHVETIGIDTPEDLERAEAFLRIQN
jgi:3-deoxy-manno-octulosonate cytidylyltransferase (CMP-KDO synthetase)